MSRRWMLAVLIAPALGACAPEVPTASDTAQPGLPSFNGGWLGGGGRSEDGGAASDSIFATPDSLDADSVTALAAEDGGGWLGGGGK